MTLPIPRLGRTSTSMMVPAFRSRSKRLKRTGRRMPRPRFLWRMEHFRLGQRTRILAVAGALTDKTRMRVPSIVERPTIRTIGNGLISPGGCAC